MSELSLARLCIHCLLSRVSDGLTCHVGRENIADKVVHGVPRAFTKKHAYVHICFKPRSLTESASQPDCYATMRLTVRPGLSVAYSYLCSMMSSWPSARLVPPKERSVSTVSWVAASRIRMAAFTCRGANQEHHSAAVRLQTGADGGRGQQRTSSLEIPKTCVPMPLASAGHGSAAEATGTE